MAVRKHPAPEGALRQLASPMELAWALGQKAPSTTRCIKTEKRRRYLLGYLLPESTQHQKAYSRGLPCGGCQQRRKTASPTARPLNRPSEPTRTTPPPRTPSSSTATKASTPGGFVPGELARFQETSRSQNASTAGAGQADANKNGRHRETRHPPTRRSFLARPRVDRQSCDQAAGPTTTQSSRPARRPCFRRGADAG